MGNYVPSRERKRRSISEALSEAESDHFLDCPNADILIRAAALFLDAVFLWLLWTGIKHSCLSLGKYASLLSGIPPVEGSSSPFSDPMAFAQYAGMVLQGSLLYGYLVWPVARYGGSPAKLLLGLRVGDIETGQRLSIPRAFAREILGKALSTVAGGLGWGMPLVRDDLRALHDLVSRSVVKRMHGEP